MKQIAIFTLFMFSFQIFDADAQQISFIEYNNCELENSKKYQDGNNFQKDLLLFIDLLKNTHPAFALPENTPLDLDGIEKYGYDFFDKYNDIQCFTQYLQNIIKPLKDGHTLIVPQNSIDKRQLLIYPVNFKILNKKVYLSAVDKQFEDCLYKEVVKINDVNVWNVLNFFQNAIFCENEQDFLIRISTEIAIFDNWKNNNYLKNDSSLSLSFFDDTEIKLKLTTFKEVDWQSLKQNESQNQITQKQDKNFFYSILDDKKLCYFQFNKCEDRSTIIYQMLMSGKNFDEKELGQFERFDEYVAEMFKEIKQKEIETLVVDLRHNGGGNSLLCDILMSYFILEPKNFSVKIRISELFKQHLPNQFEILQTCLKEKLKPLELGKLYSTTEDFATPKSKPQKLQKKLSKYFIANKKEKNLFTGNIIFIQGERTYSSAGDLIISAVDNKIGKVIGTKSRYKPCNYGDLLGFKLPNTKTAGYVSHKYFVRPDESVCEEDCITPNILFEPTMEDLINGTDNCWEWIDSHLLN